MSDRINVIADFDETNTGYVWTRPDTGEDATQVVPATAREYVLSGGTATIPLRASDDPDLSHPIRHWMEEHIDGAANPVRYAITVLRAGGSPQYLSVLRAAALASPPPAPVTSYVQTIGSDDESIDVTRSGGTVNLRAVGGGGAPLGTAPPLAGATPAVAGTAEAASHEDHQHPAIPLAVVTARSMAEDETPTDGLLRAVDPDLQIRMDDPGNVPPMTVVTVTLRAALAAIWSVLHSLGTSATRNVGTTAGTVAAGDDSRLTGAATAANLISEASTRAADDAALAGLISSEAGTRAAADSAHAILTTTAHGGIVASTDSRLTDARTPTTHASSHISTGPDAIPTAVASGASGLLSGADKAKLDSVAANATASTGTVTSVALSLPGVIFDTVVPGSPVTTSGTLAPTLKTQSANTILAGPASGAAASSTFRALATADMPASMLTEIISGAVIGKPSASAKIMRYDVGRSFSLPSGYSGSWAKADVAATASTTLTIKKNGSSIGTIVFGAAGTTGTITGSGGSFTAGTDILTVEAPSSQDATLADFGITLIGTVS